MGEVTEASAIVWMRRTAKAERNRDGVIRRGPPAGVLPPETDVAALHGACPGAAGRVRLRYGAREDLADAKATDWEPVTAANDFTHQFRLTGLEPRTVYHYAAETADAGDSPKQASLRGRFATAPTTGDPGEVRFTVVTCQGYKDIDHPEGFHAYVAMAKLDPQFFVAAGDNVYYDYEDPVATTVAVARYHWHRMHSLPRHRALHLSVPGYWMKDDHDTLADECWPGKDSEVMLPMTFRDGQRVFREQVPLGDRTYRTVRWGQGLQVWLAEGRDFRSPNTLDDGPAKSLWGPEQRRWLRETLLASDADWKVLINPTPLVGPDRDTQEDNHANATFAHEGNEFRKWVRENVADHFFVVSGDRHWQYHSVHPVTGVREFACGPASDEHAGGSPGANEDYHRFHRVGGGFLSVAAGRSAGRSAITFRLHDVYGQVVHEYGQTQKAQ